MDPLVLDQASSKKLKEILTDPQQLNAYAYARNNPLVYVDPNGENIFAIIIGVAGFLYKSAGFAYAPDVNLSEELSQKAHQTQIKDNNFIWTLFGELTKVKKLVKAKDFVDTFNGFTEKYDSLKYHGYTLGESLDIIGGVEWSVVDKPETRDLSLQKIINKSYGFQFGNMSLADQLSVNDYFGRTDFVEYAKNLESEIGNYLKNNDVIEEDSGKAEKVRRDIKRAINRAEN